MRGAALRWGVVVLGLEGCFYIPPNYYKPHDWECDPSQFSCEVGVTLETQDIVDCYGLDPLPEVLQDCASELGEDSCTLVRGSFEGEREGDTCCATPEDAEACCEGGQWDLTTLSAAEFNSWIADIQADCAITIQETELNCSLKENEDLVQGDRCDEPSKDGFEADFELDIDPALSFADIDLGNETVFTTLDGWALAAPDPKRFLVAFARGEDFEAYGDDFLDNFVYLTAEIELSGSGGTYTVPLNQDFGLHFTGIRDNEEYGYGFEPQVSSGGTFNVAGGTWTYHYSQITSNQSVEVHLQGDLVELSP